MPSATPKSCRGLSARPHYVAEPQVFARAGTSDKCWPTHLTLLLHAATERMVTALDRAALHLGLTDVRNRLVLAAPEIGVHRTQQSW